MNVYLDERTTVVISPETQVLMSCIDEVRAAMNIRPIVHHVAHPEWIRSDWESTLMRLRQQVRR